MPKAADPLDYLPGEHSFLDPLRLDAGRPEQARAVVIPFGLEASVSYGGGTAKGPAAILAASQQLERGIGPFVGVAVGLTFFDLIEQRRDPCILTVNRDADAFQFGDDVRLAGLVGDQHAAAIADAFRRNVLVGLRFFENR